MKYILLVILVCGIVSCNNRNSSMTLDDLSDSVNLKLLNSSTNITLNGKKVEAWGIDYILPYKNDIVAVNKTEMLIYVVDLSFNVKKKYAMKNEYEYLFKDRIFNAVIGSDTLYIFNYAKKALKVDLTTGNAGPISLDQAQIIRLPFRAGINKTGNYVLTHTGIIKNEYFQLEDGLCVVGYEINPQGNLVKRITVPNEVFGHEYVNEDQVLYSEVCGNNLLYFQFSNNIAVLDSQYKVKEVKTFLIGADWRKPNKDEKKGFNSSVSNFQEIVQYKNYILQWPACGKTKEKAKIIVYDLNINAIKKLFMPELKNKVYYNYFVVGDNLVVYSCGNNPDTTIYVYDLAGANLK